MFGKFSPQKSLDKCCKSAPTFALAGLFRTGTSPDRMEGLVFFPGETNLALTSVHNVCNRKSHRCVADWLDAIQNSSSCSSSNSEITQLPMIYQHVKTEECESHRCTRQLHTPLPLHSWQIWPSSLWRQLVSAQKTPIQHL